MPATNQKITHWIGDTRIVTIPIKDAAGNWVDLTGARARWWMGKSASAHAAQVWIEKNTGINGGMSIANPGSGAEWDLVITIKPVDTETLKAGTWYHEAEIVDSSLNVSTVTTGPFVLVQTMIPDDSDTLAP
jgi:hypothetical protein